MGYKLVIVESPAKAKTIEKYLPGNCKVVATMGHIIDLPASKLGVDVDNNYAPQYITIKGKAKTLNEIKAYANKADEIILATDPDREGEAISYHLANALNLSLKDEDRIEFHEITENAIKQAITHKRVVDMDLVNAQQARRVLDRLVGYKISPVLWKKIMSGLSAGRVQSVATRLIVDREDEINSFVPKEYWNISAILSQLNDTRTFEAKLSKVNGKKPELNCEEDTLSIVEKLKNEECIVGKIKNSLKHTKPYPAYTTSTLQQDANHRLNFSSKKTMMIAQQLYEGVEIPGKGHMGLVTYIRTDSVRISDVAAQNARDYISANYGKEYIGSGVIKASKNASKVQDAHEAIRPTDITFTPAMAQKSLNRDQAKLYELIYQRFLAFEMADAVYDTTVAEITCTDLLLSASGSTLKFPGFLKVYSLKQEGDETSFLPKLTTGEVLKLNEVKNEQKFTLPSPRYNEATLVKALEERGIGRPSTYAPTISTILARNYVELTDKKFFPTDIGRAVTTLLKENFKDVIDYDFTAAMETKLDEIATGKLDWIKTVDSFYKDLMVELDKSDSIEKLTVSSGEVCEICGAEMIIKKGRFGNFLACSNYPECKSTKPINSKQKPQSVESEEVCELCGAKMMIKIGRFGKFLACSAYPECKNTKPILEEIKAHCPDCGSEIIIKRTKKGRMFYGCKSYPKCTFMSWDEPTDKECPDCKSKLFVGKGKRKGLLYCANETCEYTVPVE